LLAYVSGLSNPVLYLKDLTTGRQRAISPRAVGIGAARFNATGTQVLFAVFPPPASPGSAGRPVPVAFIKRQPAEGFRK
jgi:hypothetical protein